MNSETNHLVDAELLKSLDKKVQQGYDPLPPELFGAAVQKLAGRHEATVAKHSGGKLSRHAAYRRKQKRQEQRQSRGRNR